MRYGLVGKSLSHSFSKKYFEQKFAELGVQGSSFHNYELASIDLLLAIVEAHPDLRGLSITLPYKEAIMPLLHSCSEEATQIGAVNSVHIKNGKWMGYNTDVYGFSQSLKPFLDHHHERALILGTGGASKAVAFALKKLGVEIYFVSREQKKTANTFLYSEINEHVMQAFKLVVNTTPLGTSPNIDECPPLPYQHFTPQHMAFDLVYNPAQTLFLQKAAAKGSITVNGYSMLQLQADKSWEIWNS